MKHTTILLPLVGYATGFAPNVPMVKPPPSSAGTRLFVETQSSSSAVTIPDGKATAIATGTVDAPIDEVWKVLAPFDKLDSWWPIYDDFSATGDTIGSTRTFGFKNRPGVTTTEMLIGRDDETHSVRYDLVKMEGMPLEIEGVQTVVSLTPNGDATDVLWRSWTQSPQASMLVGAQEGGYLDGIKHLQDHLNPSLGKLDVTVVSGDNFPDGVFLKPYANIVVDGSKPVTVKSKQFGSNPDFRADPVQFDILKPQSKMVITIYEEEFGVDKPVGYATVDIQKELKNGEPVTKTLELQGSADATVTVNLEMTLGSGDSLPLSKTQQELMALRSLQKSVGLIQQRAVDILKFASAPEPPVWEYERKANLPRSVKGLPRSEVLPPHKIGLMINAVTEYAETQFDLQRRLLPVANTYERYAAYFAPKGEKYVEVPKILENNMWAEDKEFLRQIFAGLNPMQVKVVSSKDGLPEKLLKLKAKDGSDVDKLIKENRLYVLDYESLRDLKKDLNGVTLYAPTMLIYRTGDKQVDVLGILLEPEREDAPVYTPGSRVPNKYLLAKLHVACADNQVHQFTYHLGFAHLAVEPMAIAAHNTLEKNDHPLGSFLKPHFRDTIGINYLARQTLVADEGAITDTTFATGTAQGVKMVEEAFKEYDFMTSGFPDELKKRGFERTDDFKGYHYRDDGWLIWDALWTYAEDMVNELYDSNADVAADEVIQAWCKEASGKDGADIRGFPEKIETKDVLVKVLTTTIWSASALHSALNYVQYPYTATPINRAASIFGGVPDGGSDITTEDILAVVPGGADQRGLGLAIFQGLLSWLLNSPEAPTLNEIGDRIPTLNNPMEWVEFRSKYPEVYKNFNYNLDQIEKIINERNEDLDIPYDVLLPSKVAASINI